MFKICNSGNHYNTPKIQIMLDNTKFLTTDSYIINRMLEHPDFIVCRPKNNYYHSLKHKKHGIKLSLDFRKAVENGNVIGYGHLEINVSPHYHFNNYLHNGNDFTPENCIKTIIDILTYLGIETNEMNALKVVNIEFGFNLILNTYFELIIKGLLYYKRTNFYQKYEYIPHYLITDTTAHKQIKVYTKGLQCHEKLNAFEVDKNTLRIEVKSKQSKYINKLDIYTAKDLLNLCKYDRLMDEVLKEWDSILLLNLNPDFDNMKKDEVEFIQNANKKSYWQDLLAENVNRNKFGRHKAKYYKILKGENNLHQQIKNKIIDKIEQFKSDANSTIELQKETSTKVFSTTKLKTKKTINLEYAPLNKTIDANKRIKEMLRSPRFQTPSHFVSVKQSIRSP